MKLFKIVLVVLLFLVNLFVAEPSFAEKKYTENPDYITVTQALSTLLPEKNTQGDTIDNVRKIANLQFQKYILETGEDWGLCRNETGKTLVVYGQKRKKSNSTYDNALYFLPDGEETDDEWDCDGLYLPSNVRVAGIDTADTTEPRGGLAYKIVDGTRLIAKTNPQTSEIELNVPPAQILRSGEANWFIPDTLLAALDSGINPAPIND